MRTGRPRSIEADDAILDATMQEFCDAGYDGLSVEAVAARAGVGKSTIYRRYPTKLELVMAAINCAKTGIVASPDTGSLRDDLREIAAGYVAMLRDSQIGRAIPMTLAAKERNPELARAHEQFVSERRSLVHAVIRRGIDRGEMPSDTDPKLIADLLTGALFNRVFITGDRVTDRYLDALVDQLVRRGPAGR